MAVTQEFIDQVKEALQTFSDSLENADETGRADFIKTVAEITDSVSLPGVRYNKVPVVNGVKVNDATAVAYVQIPWSVLSEALSRMNAAAAGAERVNTTLSGNTLTVTDRQGQSSSVDTKGATGAKGDKGDKGDAFTYADFTPAQIADLQRPATDAAASVQDAIDDCEAATAGAERVNVGLSGMTVTVTNRSGQSSSVDIGFDIYRTYSSVAAMNADAANVPQGKFVIIATTDPTSAENARLYTKNSAGSFTFLSDLDQASSEAWARWLNTYQPQIVQATTNANNAATLANTKAGVAQTAADNADTSRLAIEADEQTRQQNETTRQQAEGQRTSTFTANETQRQSDFETAQTSRNTTWTNWFSDSLSTGVRKLWNDFWTSVNSSWNGFFGTSADDTNGVRKIWSTWYAATQEAWDGWFSNSLATGVRKLWSDFWTSINSSWEDFFGTSAEDTSGVRKIWSTWYNATQTAWGTWFGTSASSGVQKAWADLASDAEDDHSTATQDHSTAEDDHTRAENDHSTATQDHGTADTDHTRAENDHSTATQDHGTADTDHTRAENDHDTATDDHATAGEDHTQAVTQTELMEAWNEHLPYVADGTAAHPGDLNYWYVYDPSAEQYVKGPYAKGDDLHWDEMSQAEKEALAQIVLEHIAFDETPTPDSTNAVTSRGIKAALDLKQDNLTFASDELCEAAAEEIVFTVSN